MKQLLIDDGGNAYSLHYYVGADNLVRITQATNLVTSEPVNLTIASKLRNYLVASADAHVADRKAQAFQEELCAY